MWTDRWMDKQSDKKRTNEQTELHQFRKEPSYDGDLSSCQFEFDWTHCFRVRVRKRKMWTDVRYINLIGGLVTRNPPNKKGKK